MDLTEERLDSREVFRGHIVTLTVDQVRLPNGGQAAREVARHPDGVAVLALDEAGRAVLVTQYRYPLGRTLLEIPAGKLDGGEEPRAGALRELEEEAGVRPDELTELGAVYVSPGFCDEKSHRDLARGLHQAASHPDEDEFLSVSRMPFDRLVELVLSGQVEDGKTVAAVLKAKLILDK